MSWNCPFASLPSTPPASPPLAPPLTPPAQMHDLVDEHSRTAIMLTLEAAAAKTKREIMEKEKSVVKDDQHE